MSATHPQPVPLHPAATEVKPEAPIVTPIVTRAERNVLRRVLMFGGVLVVLGASSALYLTGGRYVGTDDAYVKAAQLTVTTDVSGIVASVDVQEGQRVKKGDVLFTLDPEPFQIALANAEAALVQAQMTVSTLKADYKNSLQKVRAQEAQVDVAKTTLDRYEALANRGAITQTQIDQQRATYLSAIATLDSLRESVAADLARLGGNRDLPVEQYPDDMKARAAVHEAKRLIAHTVVRAPFDGIVTAVSSLQPGTLIISAMSAFSTTSAVGLVSDSDMWIEANMKETDLARVREGQPVDIHIDTYPDCRWSGTVEAISAASGAAFSPLPAQNTSGNWVKVVQRIPVHVRLGESNCDARLSAGMSTTVSIDTGEARWQRLGF